MNETTNTENGNAVGGRMQALVSREPDWQVTAILADGLFIETDCNSGKTRRIRTTKCQCGKSVEIQYDANSGRRDRKMVYHPEDRGTGWCLFRCKGCGQPVGDSVPGAEYDG